MDNLIVASVLFLLTYIFMIKFVNHRPIVVGISAFAGALLLYEIIRRIPIICWCVLGLKKEKKDVYIRTVSRKRRFSPEAAG